MFRAKSLLVLQRVTKSVVSSVAFRPQPLAAANVRSVHISVKMANRDKASNQVQEWKDAQKVGEAYCV